MKGFVALIHLQLIFKIVCKIWVATIFKGRQEKEAYVSFQP